MDEYMVVDEDGLAVRVRIDGGIIASIEVSQGAEPPACSWSAHEWRSWADHARVCGHCGVYKLELDGAVAYRPADETSAAYAEGYVATRDLRDLVYGRDESPVLAALRSVTGDADASLDIDDERYPICVDGIWRMPTAVEMRAIKFTI